MKKLLTALALTGALISLPNVAQAANGYVCSVMMYNYSALGTGGGLYISFYTGPNCTGSFAYTGYMCSTSATSNVCASSSQHSYTGDQIIGLLQQVAESARTGRYLNYSGSSACKVSGSTCLAQVYFQ